MVHSCKLASIQDCCGALVIHDLFENKMQTLDVFGKTQRERTERGYGHVTQIYVDTQNHSNQAETRSDYLKRIDTFINRQCTSFKGSRSYILIALNQVQKPLLHDIVLKNSFEVLVPEMPNPNGTKITLYIHYLLPKPGTLCEPKTSIIKR